MQEAEISFHELNLSIREVFETMGYGDTTPDSNIQQQTSSLLNDASLIARPRFLYFFANGMIKENGLFVKNTTLNTGKIITRQLRNAELFAFFVATAGQEFEEWMHHFKQDDDILSAYIADSIGSCVAEHAADYMERNLGKEISVNGWLHTNRYSPGYCEWHVNDQEKLFSLFPTSTPCGVTLNDSSLMKPVKSISGVIGIGTQVKRLEYSCGLCTFENCYKKKRR